jgi:hypothetical protein
MREAVRGQCAATEIRAMSSAEGGTLYRVTVAAEIDMYPTLAPWVFVTPTLRGAREDGKVRIEEPWQPETSRFAPVIAAVVMKIEAAQGAASDV